jgi:ABC-type tungstate transport system permease subunit
MKIYNPANWYWIVGGDESRVFSSAIGNYVPADDAAYLAWRADGALPTRIVSEAELGEVLADARVRPQRAAVLDAYKGQHAKRMTDEVQSKAILWCINEILTLKGQPTITTGPAIRNFLKDLM